METRIHTGAAATPKTRAQARKLSAYTQHIAEVLEGKEYTLPESSLRIAGDAKYQNAVAKKIAHLMDVEHVVLVGIGGSSLGVEAVYSALKHTTTKQLHVIDAIEEDYLSAFESLCQATPRKESIACVVVSKSGNTSETLVNAARVIAIGTERYGESFLTQVVCIGNDNTDFFKSAKKKKPFSFQILPIVSSSIDLHSMAQLYLGGYVGIYTYFVHTRAPEQKVSEVASWIHAHMPMLTAHSRDEVKDAIREGVLAAYQDAKLPYAEIQFDGQTPYEVGAYMASALYEVMCLCHLFDVDAFGQPQVELYKKHTRTLLSK